MPESLKEKSGAAFFWNFLDKGGQQAIQLVFLTALARLLTEDDFGMLTVLAIFTAVANILQESGFSAALIRKKDVCEADYSSVFYFNIAISLFIYSLFYFSSPLIAAYYERPELTGLSRVIFLSFVFNAFGIIQNVHLYRRMDFRSNTGITLTAGLISGIAAILMAYSGYGVWSLAVQAVLQPFIRSLLLWIVIKWRPSLLFSYDRLKSMATYSFKLLATSIFNQATAYVYPMIIGKSFSMKQVGYYGQANKLNTIPQSIISESIQGVAYPLLTQLDNEERLRRIFRRFVRMASFICFPVAMLLIITAQPVVEIVLSEKFLRSAPILQLLAVSGAAYPLYVLSGALMKAIGKSGLLLKSDLIRNALLIASALITCRLGILAMVVGYSAVYIFSLAVSFYFSGKEISYRLSSVFGDMFPYIAISLLVFLPLYFLRYAIDNNWLLLTLQVIIGSSGYLSAVKLLGSRVMEDCWQFVKNKRI
ncbi:MAG: lipopolysaccharide biosynthesis protein [Prevotella sp.]|jgi:O-antigen/teichoic acid export membrane protein|nr:lipopolysaccharide biosynthesis protein [Prevotella sp.]